jgi:uncharacterized protein YndB with AHSA1/START domain
MIEQPSKSKCVSPPRRTVVFAYFIDPELYQRWKGNTPELDPRPGGLYRVLMPSGDLVRGEYVTVEPPTRVVFTWGFQGSSDLPPGASTVEITLHADGDDTIVRLRHERLRSDESRQQHEIGWQHYLERLALVASSKDPGPDWN